MDADAQRDPVHVGEQAHFHDGEGPVFLAFPMLAMAVFVGLFDFKAEVVTVIIQDPGAPLAQGEAIFVQGALDKIGFFRQHVQGPVNLVLLKSRFFQQGFGKRVGGPLGAGFQNPAVDQSGQDGVQVVPKGMAFGDGPTDLAQPKAVVQALQEQVADLEGALVILGQLLGSGKGQPQILAFLSLLGVELRDVPFGPCVWVLSIRVSDVVLVSKLFDGNGMFFAMAVIIGFDGIKEPAIFGFGRTNAHLVYLPI